MDQIKEELADVLIYAVMMADTCNLDMDQIILDKMKKNAAKYPAEAAINSKEKYDKLK